MVRQNKSLALYTSGEIGNHWLVNSNPVFVDRLQVKSGVNCQVVNPESYTLFNARIDEQVDALNSADV